MIANSEPDVRSSIWLVRLRFCSPDMLAVWSIPVKPRLCAILFPSLSSYPATTSPRIEARNQEMQGRFGFGDEGNEDQSVICL
jgi:hypothetical protein